MSIWALWNHLVLSLLTTMLSSVVSQNKFYHFIMPIHVCIKNLLLTFYFEHKTFAKIKSNQESGTTTTAQLDCTQSI